MGGRGLQIGGEVGLVGWRLGVQQTGGEGSYLAHLPTYIGGCLRLTLFVRLCVCVVIVRPDGLVGLHQAQSASPPKPRYSKP